MVAGSGPTHPYNRCSAALQGNNFGDQGSILFIAADMPTIAANCYHDDPNEEIKHKSLYE